MIFKLARITSCCSKVLQRKEVISQENATGTIPTNSTNNLEKAIIIFPNHTKEGKVFRPTD